MRSLVVLGWLVATAVALPAAGAGAPPAQQLLERLAAEAGRENPGFRAFSAERGGAFYRTQRMRADGTKAACSGCHTGDPRAPGRTRANKDILPLAPVANAERLTDPAKVEKWFARNCMDVLERPCTASEKGDFVAYLLSLR